MDIINIRYIVYHGSEERNLEYKKSMSWNKNDNQIKIVKAAMAMANIPGGGFIVIGVNKKNNDQYEPEGMDDDDYSSYDQDCVQEKINEYSDPYIEIKLNKFEDNGKKFIVIQVSEFNDIPVICKKNGLNIKEGQIYTRPKRKISSVPISSQTEMRELIEMSIEKIFESRIAQFHKFKLSELPQIKEISKKKYSEQIKRDRDNIDDKINVLFEKGSYWETIIKPIDYIEKRVSNNKKLIEILDKCCVNYGISVFPLFDKSIINKISISNDFIEYAPNINIINRTHDFFEYWRFYQNGQFIYYSPVNWFVLRESLNLVVYIEWAVWKITLIYEFCRRLAHLKEFNSPFVIVNNIKGIKGYYLQYRRQSLLNNDLRSNINNNKEIKLTSELSTIELLTKGHEEAINKTLEFFYFFNHYAPNKNLLKEEQLKLLEKRL